MKITVTYFLCLFTLSFAPALARGQVDIDNIDDFAGATTGQNCTGTHQTVTAPGWEWNCDPSIANCSYTVPGDICGNSEWNNTIDRDGQSREMDLTWNYSQKSGTEYGGVNFHVSINSGAGDPTDTYFSWGGWFYYTDLSDINQLEFDLNQVLDNGNGTTSTIIYAAQCNFAYVKSTGTGWWEFSNGWTIVSDIPCLKTKWTKNTWHHVVISAHRGALANDQSTVTYDSVSFDGSTVVDGTDSANGAYQLGWGPVGLLLQNVQLDMGFTASGGTTAYADLMTTNSPQSTKVGSLSASPAPGTYSSPQTVTVSTSTAGATICYTTDGTTPTTNGGGECVHGNTYTGPIVVSVSETLKGIGTKDGIDFDSPVATAKYVIQ